MSEMNGGSQVNGMAGGMVASSPSSSMGTTTHRGHMMMHMTFYWGNDALVLFAGWPGKDNLGMYILSLIFVFALALLVEWLSHSNFTYESSDDNVRAGLVQTLVYGIRACLGYLVMIGVMSFNGGVFIVAVVGHMFGFLVFGSRVFKKSATASGKTSDLPPRSCAC